MVRNVVHDAHQEVGARHLALLSMVGTAAVSLLVPVMWVYQWVYLQIDVREHHRP